MIAPVVARSPIAASTASATSAGVANRRSGVASRWPSNTPAGNDDAYSPSTHPGDTDTTRIVGASERPSDRVIESSAAFDAQYATLLPCPVTPATDEMLTTTAAVGEIEQRAQRTDHCERPAPVDAEDAVDQLVVELVEVGVWHRAGDPRCVDEHVQITEGLADSPGQLVDIPGVVHTAAHREVARAGQRVDHSLSAVEAARHSDDHRRAALGQAATDLRADAAAAGDDCMPTSEIDHDGLVV